VIKMKLLGLNREEVKQILKEGKVTITVYGLGKMGLPLATVFAEYGAKVIGVDINEKVVEIINKGKNHIKEEPGLDELVKKNVEAGRLKATTDGILAAKQADVMIILVPTLADKKGNLKEVHLEYKLVSIPNAFPHVIENHIEVWDFEGEYVRVV